MVATILIVVALGVYVERIDRRVKLMKMRMDRLSVTFLKIETDLEAIQSSLLVMSREQGEETAAVVAKLRNRRNAQLRLEIEQGPTISQVLRGLEFPDIDEDPAFWARDRMKRFGLEEPESSRDSEPG
jgi:hypothetical protein